jgi:hypothetical protein
VEDEMLKAWFIVVLGAVLGASFGCGEDEPTGGGTGGASGSGGLAGSAGAAGGGQAGSGGGSGASGSSGSAGTEAGPPSGLLLVTGTDYFSSSEVAAIDVATGNLSATVAVADGDAVPVASGGRGFVLQRTNDIVLALGSDGAIDKTIPVGGADGGTKANPTGVAAIGTTAYVTLHDASQIAVLDLAQGSVEKSIDLAQYLAAGDADGSVDVSNPIYDPATGRVYVTLGRIDITTAWAPPYELACPSVPALILAFDATSGDAIDLNGAAAGNAVELQLANPIDVALDAEGSRLLVLAAGCFAPSEAGTSRTGHGVEAFDLKTSTSSLLLVPTDASYFSRILYLGGGEALVNRFDESFGEHWHRWNTSDSALGAELSAVPAGPTYDGAGGLLGVAFASHDGGSSASVVRYDLASETASVIKDDPWQASFSASGGSALVKP